MFRQLVNTSKIAHPAFAWNHGNYTVKLYHMLLATSILQQVCMNLDLVKKLVS